MFVAFIGLSDTPAAAGFFVATSYNVHYPIFCALFRVFPHIYADFPHFLAISRALSTRLAPRYKHGQIWT